MGRPAARSWCCWRPSSGGFSGRRGASWTTRRWRSGASWRSAARSTTGPVVALTLVRADADDAGVLRAAVLLSRRPPRRAGALAEAHPGSFVNLELYDELYLRLWWARDAHRRLPAAAGGLAAVLRAATTLLDFGLRGRGFAAHAWIYALCVMVMVPVLLLVSRQPDFVDVLPDLQAGGAIVARLLRLGGGLPGSVLRPGAFFRGFWLRALRGFGSGAIWSMAVPYCMIHYGKPYLEVCAAIVARRRAGLAGDAHAQHLRRVPDARDRRGAAWTSSRFTGVARCRYC